MSTQNEQESDKVEAVISPDEVEWLTALGLGRGVDATKSNLWAEKSLLQVQTVSKSLNNIICTDEGGVNRFYRREISSLSTRQTQLKLSVDEPNTSVHIGMDTVYSESDTRFKVSVGEQVLTRTISFRDSFDDLPLQHIDTKVLERVPHSHSLLSSGAGPTLPADVKSDAVKPFEEKLSDWLLDRIRGRGQTVPDIASDEGTPKIDCSAAKLGQFLESIAGQEGYDEVVQDCHLFLKATNVTHYIHSIQLGAMRFRVLESAEFNKKFGIKGDLGAEGIAKSSLGYTSSTLRRHYSEDKKEIGKIRQGSVRRGTRDEAVIGFKLKPILKLIRSYHINDTMKRALRDYIVEKMTRNRGPYLISCGNEKMRLYWKVEDNRKVIATPDVEAASIFFLSVSGDADYPYEFKILYYGEDEDALMRPKGILDPMSKSNPLAPLPLYLNGTVSMFGRNKEPLEMKPNVNEAHVRFVLHSRVFDKNEPVNLNTWMLGEEFYINNSRRPFKWDGYLAVKKTKLLTFTTVIVPFESSHNGIDTWQLFHLMPAEHRSVNGTNEPK